MSLVLHWINSLSIGIVIIAIYNKIHLKCFILFRLLISFLKQCPPFLSAAALEYVNERRLDGKNCHFLLPQAGFTLFWEKNHFHSAFKPFIFNPISLQLSAEMSAAAERSTSA